MKKSYLFPFIFISILIHNHRFDSASGSPSAEVVSPSNAIETHDAGTFDRPLDLNRAETPAISTGKFESELESRLSGGGSLVRAQPHQLKAMRRVGGLALIQNVNDLRQKLNPQVSDFKGFVGLPLNGPEIEGRLSVLVEQACESNGRFWYLPTSVTGAYESLREDANAREKLSRIYDLDGWVSFKIDFFPDHTLVSGVLYGSDGFSQIAEENVNLAAMATEQELFSGFNRIWARLAETLGHIGSISWQSGELVTVDIGYPAVTLGQKLLAGKVFVTRRHPRTGEILETDHQPLFELEVIETQETSSLARLTGTHISVGREDAQKNANKNEPMNGLLVWKAIDHSTERIANNTWQKDSFARHYSQQGNTGIGFKLRDSDFEEQSLEVPTVEHLYSPPEGRARSMAQSDLPQAVSKQALQNPVPPSENQPVDESLKSQRADAEQERMPPPLFPYGEKPWIDSLVDPSGWLQHSATLSLGQSWGILNTTPCQNTPCERFSGFPKSLVNLIGASIGYYVTRSSMLDFQAEIAFYNGGDTEGFDLKVKAKSSHLAFAMGKDRLHLMLSPELSIGTVRTVLVSKSLNHFGLLGGAAYALEVPVLGNFTSSIELSLVDLFRGRFQYDFGLKSEYIYGLPRELGFFLHVEQPQSKWTKIFYGATWKMMLGSAHGY